MRPYATLDRRGQLARLRGLARAALTAHGLEHARLTALRHEHNTTFRVDGRDGPYVLRIHRPGVHAPATIGSELAWLLALRRDTALRVPEPVATRDGALVVMASDPGVPEPRACVLLRRLPGRFADASLTPPQLRAVARLQAGLQDHARGWTPPPGFARPAVEGLTKAARNVAVAPGADTGEHPAREDAGAALQLIADLVSPAAAAIGADALDRVRATTRALAGERGLIHGDLHQENYLFADGQACAIDFDDAGWGCFLYDLAVTRFELEEHPRGEALRAAVLDAYAALRPLPPDAEARLADLTLLRSLQMLMWALESRDHAAFRGTWRTWADDVVRDVAGRLEH